MCAVHTYYLIFLVNFFYFILFIDMKRKVIIVIRIFELYFDLKAIMD